MMGPSKKGRLKADRESDSDDETSSSESDPALPGNVVTEFRAADIFLGRGAPMVNYVGNVDFRALVRSRHNEFCKAKLRARKSEIAREVLNEIKRRGGRFLRTRKSKDGHPQGELFNDDTWGEIDDAAATVKIKQALRSKDRTATYQRTAASTAGTHLNGSSINVSLPTETIATAFATVPDVTERNQPHSQNILPYASLPGHPFVQDASQGVGYASINPFLSQNASSVSALFADPSLHLPIPSAPAASMPLSMLLSQLQQQRDRQSLQLLNAQRLQHEHQQMVAHSNALEIRRLQMQLQLQQQQFLQSQWGLGEPHPPWNFQLSGRHATAANNPQLAIAGGLFNDGGMTVLSDQLRQANQRANWNQLFANVSMAQSSNGGNVPPLADVGWHSSLLDTTELRLPFNNPQQPNIPPLAGLALLDSSNNAGMVVIGAVNHGEGRLAPDSNLRPSSSASSSSSNRETQERDTRVGNDTASSSESTSSSSSSGEKDDCV